MVMAGFEPTHRAPCVLRGQWDGSSLAWDPPVIGCSTPYTPLFLPLPSTVHLHHSTLPSPKYLKKPSPPLADDRIPSATSLLMESRPMARALSRRRVSAPVRSPAPPRSCSPRRLLDLGHPVCPGSKSTAMPVDFYISIWEKWGNL